MTNIGHNPGQIVIITGAEPSDNALADTGDGPLAIPEPPIRPDPKAQWDEVHGRWIHWDDDAHEWVPESQPLVVDLRDDVASPVDHDSVEPNYAGLAPHAR